MKTITIDAQTRDTVRFFTLYDPATHKWELIKASTLHVGSYDNALPAQKLAAFWNDVHFEPTPLNYTKVFIRGHFVGEIARCTSNGTAEYFIDRRVQDAVGMVPIKNGYRFGSDAERAILNAWKDKCEREGKKFP